jgi:uncharacterized protein
MRFFYLNISNISSQCTTLVSIDVGNLGGNTARQEGKYEKSPIFRCMADEYTVFRRHEKSQGGSPMQAKLIHEGEEKTYVLIFGIGDEVASGLLDFAREKKIEASHFTAIGAFSEVTLGYFDWTKKDYKKIAVREQVEVLSLVGNIVVDNGDSKLHAHAVIGKSDGTAHGGHLLEARVRPILEVVLVESPAHLHRKVDKETGLPLINFEPD